MLSGMNGEGGWQQEVILSAVLEAAIDNYLLQPGNLQKYGMVEVVDRDGTQQAVTSLAVWATRLVNGSGTHTAYFANGGETVARSIGLDAAMPIKVSATNGALVQDRANVHNGLLNQLVRKLQASPAPIIILDDVVDTGVSLIEGLRQLITELNNIQYYTEVDPKEVELLITKLYLTALQVPFAKHSEFNKQSFAGILDDLLVDVKDLLGIHVAVFANKLFANGNPQGLFLALPDRRTEWLMGMGMDTEVKVEWNGKQIPVSIGRNLDRIVALTDPSKLKDLIRDVMAQLSLTSNGAQEI